MPDEKQIVIPLDAKMAGNLLMTLGVPMLSLVTGFAGSYAAISVRLQSVEARQAYIESRLDTDYARKVEVQAMDKRLERIENKLDSLMEVKHK